MNEKIEWYDEVFDFIEIHHPDWERLLMGDKIKIKTSQNEVQFEVVEKILQRFNLKITDISFTDYYGIIIGIKKI